MERQTNDIEEESLSMVEDSLQTNDRKESEREGAEDSKEKKTPVLPLLLLVALLLLLVILIPLAKNGFRTPNGCSFFFQCGIVSNNASSANYITVAKNWKSDSDSVAHYSSESAPSDSILSLNPGESSYRFTHYDGIYIPSGCSAQRGNEKLEGDTWYRKSDTQKEVISVSCDSYGVSE